MKTFVVTSGTYSDYSICGVFSTKGKAEAFRKHYNHDRVEEFELDPETPRSDLFLFKGTWRARKDLVKVRRISNGFNTPGMITLTSYDRNVIGYLWAKDEEQAIKAWKETVRSIKAGCTFVVERTDEWKDEVKTLDPREHAKSRRRDVFKTFFYYQGKFTLVHTTKGEWV